MQRSSNRGTRRDYRWRKKAARERKRLEDNPDLAVCSLCGLAIDMTLPPLNPGAFTLDHITPLAQGGDILGPTRPAHRGCNSSREGARKRSMGAKKPKTILEW